VLGVLANLSGDAPRPPLARRQFQAIDRDNLADVFARAGARESDWPGLCELVRAAETGERLRIRVLDVSRQELRQDFADAFGFAPAGVFHRASDEPFDSPGGEPFGLLVCADEFNVADPADFALLRELTGVAAAAHAVLVTDVGPQLFERESWADLAPANLGP